MMDWLGGWLRSIILIILIATFIDLLLPNHSLQRYVKTVISLFILMTLLSPVFQIFQKKWDLGSLIQMAQQDQDRRAGQPDYLRKESSPSLSSILAESRKLKANDDQQALKLTEQRVAEQIEQKLKAADGGSSLTGVQVQAALDKQGTPLIRHVEVRLSAAKAEQALKQEAAASASPSIPAAASGSRRIGDDIRPIDPVQIDIEPITINPEAKPAPNAAAASTEPHSAGLNKLEAEIKSSIAQDWQVPEQQIEIAYS